jgi:hypothetical protein
LLRKAYKEMWLYFDRDCLWRWNKKDLILLKKLVDYILHLNIWNDEYNEIVSTIKNHKYKLLDY